MSGRGSYVRGVLCLVVYDRYRTQARLEGIPDSELVPRSKIQHRLFKYSKTKKGRAAIDYVEPAEARRKRRERTLNAALPLLRFFLDPRAGLVVVVVYPSKTCC